MSPASAKATVDQPASAKATAAKHDVHVLTNPAGAGWRVTQGGRTVSSHRKQSTAVKAGIREARRHAVDLVTHARDGRIRSKDSYGNESPARDTER